MYSFHSRVRFSETDEYGKLGLTGIINYLQDTSTFHSEDLGVGLGYLEGKRKAWMLLSWQIVILSSPALGQDIVVETWPYDFKGIYGYRNFTIRDKDGAYLVKANSIWFLVNLDTGKPQRVLAEDVSVYGVHEPRLEMEYAPRRILIPEAEETGRDITIMSHHIDTNHHVNNAQYVEIAREALPEVIYPGEIRAEYKKAAVLGDVMTPHTSRTDNGYVVSLCDAESRLFAVVEFVRTALERV